MLTPDEIETERVEFEAWAIQTPRYGGGFRLRLKRSGELYESWITHCACEAWLARAEQAKRDNEAREAGA